MDLSKAIQELYAEKEKLEQAIALLDELQRSGTRSPARIKGKSRRGRKAMSREEREQVSERMRKYWAARRTDESPPPGKSKLPAK